MAEARVHRHRVAVVINTRAGHVRRDPGVVHRVTEAVGRGATVIAAGTLADLDRGLERARDEDVDVVGVVGGDGTVGVTVTAVARAWEGRELPAVAFLRGGTMNTVANAVGVPRGRPEALARRLRGLVESGRFRTAPRGTVRARERLGFLFGTGSCRATCASTTTRVSPRRSPPRACSPRASPRPPRAAR
ncbi:MAG: diacylglycerol kinase family protein [Polyangiales bacterium]